MSEQIAWTVAWHAMKFTSVGQIGELGELSRYGDWPTDWMIGGSNPDRIPDRVFDTTSLLLN